MRYLIDFLDTKTVETSIIFEHLKVTQQEATLLKEITKQYIGGNEEVVVLDTLISLFGEKKYNHIKQLHLIKNLLDQGWITLGAFVNLKISDTSNLELLNSTVTLSSPFLKLLEDGTLDMELPDVVPYKDHLEYLKDQFLRIEMYQKLSLNKQNSVNINSLTSKLKLLESRISARVEASEIEIAIEKILQIMS